MAKIEKQVKEQEKEKEVFVDLNEAPEDVEEVRTPRLLVSVVAAAAAATRCPLWRNMELI